MSGNHRTGLRIFFDLSAYLIFFIAGFGLGKLNEDRRRNIAELSVSNTAASAVGQRAKGQQYPEATGPNWQATARSNSLGTNQVWKYSPNSYYAARWQADTNYVEGYSLVEKTNSVFLQIWRTNGFKLELSVEGIPARNLFP